MKTLPRARLALLLSAASLAAACSTSGSGGTAATTQPTKPAANAKAPAEQSVPDLRASMGSPDLMVRMAAVEELGRRAPSSPDAVNAVVEAFGDREPLIRRFAAGGLSQLQTPSASTVLALGRLLSDKELDPRESAARTLAALTPRAPAETTAELAGMLVAATADPGEGVRQHAFEALGGLGVRAARAVPAVRPAFERALGDPSDTVRGAAAEAAGKIGSGVAWTVPLLTKVLADPMHDVRKMAVISLEKIGPDAAPASKALARQLHGKEIYLRVFAADALAAIGPAAKAALPDLKALAAKGYKELEGSPEVEAGQLPEAVAKAIRSIEGKGGSGPKS